jgi:hypothetical protein
MREFVTYRYGGHSMSDTGTPYRTRDEATNMCSTQGPIQGLRKLILEWGVFTEEELKALEKEAKLLVDKVVAEAEESPIPENTADVMVKDIYVLGSEPRALSPMRRRQLAGPSSPFDRGLRLGEQEGGACFLAVDAIETVVYRILNNPSPSRFQMRFLRVMNSIPRRRNCR